MEHTDDAVCGPKRLEGEGLRTEIMWFEGYSGDVQTRRQMGLTGVKNPEMTKLNTPHQ